MGGGRVGYGGGLQPPEAIEVLKLPAAKSKGVWPPALGNFCNFSIKVTHFYTRFGQNSYFKAETHQLIAFEKHSKRTK